VVQRLALCVPTAALHSEAGASLRHLQVLADQRLLVADGEALPDDPPTRWAIRQVGLQLILQPEPEVEHPEVLPALRPGSPVGSFQAARQLVVVRDGHREAPQRLVPGLPVPLSGAQRITLDSGHERLELSTLTRADDGGWARMGRDRFGLWAELDVKRAKAEATQRFRWVAPGRFMMGSAEDEEGHLDREGPQHMVTLSHGYWMADTPVTQALYLAVMGVNPSTFTEPADLRRPVEQVSWDDGVAFTEQLQRLTQANGGAGDGLVYRLPSEAEWERACRAGSTGATYAPAGKALKDIAWFDENAGGTTHPVGGLLPNAWGLHDTLGNVWEWCADYLRRYPVGPSVDPLGSGPIRANRGGSWRFDAQDARAAYRYAYVPSLRNVDLGLRLSRGRAHQQPASSDPAWTGDRSSKSGARTVARGSGGRPRAPKAEPGPTGG
jgi:formylglycine-generating enzyme required for sulfatase activity